MLSLSDDLFTTEEIYCPKIIYNYDSVFISISFLVQLLFFYTSFDMVLTLK